MPIFNGALAGGADYLDMAMSLSQRHPAHPYRKTGVKLGDERFDVEDQWRAAGRRALVGIALAGRFSCEFASARARSMRPVYPRVPRQTLRIELREQLV
jgi:hypothetical protein